MTKKTIQYIPKDVCSKCMYVIVDDNKIEDVKFIGGCQGSATGIQRLIKGMEVKDVIDKLEGVPCGNRTTSCPDQLTKCLKEYLEKESKNENN